MARILVASHDAGGAEVVSAWVRAHPEHHYDFVLAGPAVTVFKRKLPSIVNETLHEVPQLLPEVDQVLTGTSWAADLERQVIAIAREKLVPSVSFLDHWCNYRQRFRLDGQFVWPNAIWVGDNEAHRLAKEEFHGEPIELELVPNPHYEEIKREYASITPPQSHEAVHLLYVCEPVGAHTLAEFGDDRYYGYNEFDALEYFLGILEEANPHADYCVRVRPHPAEEPDRYDYILHRKTHVSIQRTRGTSLLEDLRWADGVVGVASMALVIATIVDKKTYSCTPPNGTTMELHHPEIRRLTAGSLI